MMKYSWLVATREFAENVKTKGFWIGVLLFPVLLVASIQVPKFLRDRATPTRHFVLIDKTGKFDAVVERAIRDFHTKRILKALGEYAQQYSKFAKKTSVEDLEKAPAVDPERLDQLVDQMIDASGREVELFQSQGGLQARLEQLKGFLVEDAPPFEEPRRLFERVTELPEGVAAEQDPQKIVEALRPYLVGDERLAGDRELFAAIVIPEGADRRLRRPDRPASFLQQNVKKGVQYWSTNLADTDLKRVVESGINKEIRRLEYEDESIDTALVKRIQGTRIAFAALNPKKEEGKEQVSLADTLRQYAPIGFVYLLFVALMTTAQMLLNNTVEEKSNRIIEVLLSSVTPGELMTGKLLGIAGVGLLMLVTWIISIVGVLYFMSGPEVEWAGVLFDVVKSSGLLWVFTVYFVLGYLLYAGIFLAIGSVCSTLKEAQNFMGPVMLIMMVPLLTMVFIPKDPNGTLATVLTWIPLYTPFVMMNRAAADPPMFDVMGSGALLVVSIVVMLWASGKIFKLAILRTGQPPKLLEMFRWLKA